MQALEKCLKNCPYRQMFWQVVPRFSHQFMVHYLRFLGSVYINIIILLTAMSGKIYCVYNLCLLFKYTVVGLLHYVCQLQNRDRLHIGELFRV